MNSFDVWPPQNSSLYPRVTRGDSHIYGTVLSSRYATMQHVPWLVTVAFIQIVSVLWLS